MRLKLTNKMPPGGYRYEEPSLKWVAPMDLTMRGAEDVAQALSAARLQNPGSGLDSSLEACRQAVAKAVWDRFEALPALRKRYVVVDKEPLGKVMGASAVSSQAIRPIKRSGGGCASCGGRRVVRK